MIYCRINGRVYPVGEGAVFSENYNETLDSGTITLDQVRSKIDITPFDVIEIWTEGQGVSMEPRRMCVDQVTTTELSLLPKIYRYEISLFSETKLLENVVCPNLAITRRAQGGQKTVHDYLRQYLSLYGEKTQSDPLRGAHTDRFSLGESLDRFKTIECPEMQWNQPTLREVFNDLMMVDDCIPVVKNNVIECIDISQIGAEISDDQKKSVNYITESYSSADYVSDVKMHLVNATNNRKNQDTAARIVENIGFRNGESYLLTTENMRLETTFPIWELISCVINCPSLISGKYTGMTTEGNVITGTFSANVDYPFYLKGNGNDYIPEYAEWLTKDVYYMAWNITGLKLDANYRNRCLYYTRGSKNIYNFNEKTEQSFLFIKDAKYVFEMIVTSIRNDPGFEQKLDKAAKDTIMAQHPELVRDTIRLIDPVSGVASEYKTAVFNVEYEPIDDSVFSASKAPFQKNRRQIIDNQTNSYIDTERQGMLEYLKANRLGNKLAMVNARYSTSEQYIPKLSQTIDGRILFHKEIAVYANHLDVNYQATENYVLRDYFTGIRSKIRSWNVVSGGEAMTRSELVKFYVNENIPSVRNERRVIPSYATTDEYFEKLKYCVMRFFLPGGSARPTDTLYKDWWYRVNSIAVEFTKHRIGNSAVFTVKMPDNYFAGTYVSNYSGTDGRVEQKGIAYADANGEVLSCMLYFLDEWNSQPFGNEEANRALLPLTQVYPNPSSEDLAIDIANEHVIAAIPVVLYKDNKEIPQISVQFEINGEANDMFLGRK